MQVSCRRAFALSLLRSDLMRWVVQLPRTGMKNVADGLMAGRGASLASDRRVAVGALLGNERSTTQMSLANTITSRHSQLIELINRLGIAVSAMAIARAARPRTPISACSHA